MKQLLLSLLLLFSISVNELFAQGIELKDGTLLNALEYNEIKETAKLEILLVDSSKVILDKDQVAKVKYDFPKKLFQRSKALLEFNLNYGIGFLEAGTMTGPDVPHYAEVDELDFSIRYNLFKKLGIGGGISFRDIILEGVKNILYYGTLDYKFYAKNRSQIDLCIDVGYYLRTEIPANYLTYNYNNVNIEKANFYSFSYDIIQLEKKIGINRSSLQLRPRINYIFRSKTPFHFMLSFKCSFTHNKYLSEYIQIENPYFYTLSGASLITSFLEQNNLPTEPFYETEWVIWPSFAIGVQYDLERKVKEKKKK